MELSSASNSRNKIKVTNSVLFKGQGHEVNESTLDIVAVELGLVVELVVGLLVEAETTIDAGIGGVHARGLFKLIYI